MKKQNFTLVELLVVIAIIAILAAMLLPALNRARDTAKSTACLNNQKQVMLSVALYENSFGGWIHTMWDGDTSWTRVMQREGFFSDRTYPKETFCPAMDTKLAKEATYPVKYSYGGVALLNGYMSNSGYQRLRMMMIGQHDGYYNVYVVPRRARHPSRVIFIGDSYNAFSGVGRCCVTVDATALPASGNNPGSFSIGNHSGHGNFAFLDGHAEVIKDEFPELIREIYKNEGDVTLNVVSYYDKDRHFVSK